MLASPAWTSFQGVEGEMIERRELLQGMALLPGLSLLPLLSSAAAATVPPPQSRIGAARIVLQDGRLWIQVRFGGRGPYLFIIDTGAFTNLIRKDVARELKLKERGATIMSGVGGTQGVTLYDGADVAFGNIGVGTIAFAGYDETLRLHPEAVGALSGSMLTAADCDFDFDALEWRIYPDGRGARDGFELLPSDIRASARRGGAPPVTVDAAIGGETYRLQVDTGAPGQIALFAGATRRSGLWNDGKPFVPIQRRGIGGEGSRGRLVRIPQVRLGNIAFDSPLVSLSDPGQRELIGVDGVLGLELIERMNLSSDVKAGRLWARRNARPPRPERYAMSGVWLEGQGSRVTIASLSPGSPAAEAGLRIGDELTGGTLREWISRLAGRPGATLDIPYTRAGTAGTAHVTLRPYL
jgi:hypothetical protein